MSNYHDGDSPPVYFVIGKSKIVHLTFRDLSHQTIIGGTTYAQRYDSGDVEECDNCNVNLHGRNVRIIKEPTWTGRYRSCLGGSPKEPHSSAGELWEGDT